MSNVHQPYAQRFKHREDFRIKYCFYSREEGGRRQLPAQGIRSDFWHEHSASHPNQIYIIWPEFETESGELIVEGTVKPSGTARMWIIFPKMRPYHQAHIQVGTRGYFREGARRTGECEVIEIVGLLENPTA